MRSGASAGARRPRRAHAPRVLALGCVLTIALILSIPLVFPSGLPAAGTPTRAVAAVPIPESPCSATAAQVDCRQASVLAPSSPLVSADVWTNVSAAQRFVPSSLYGDSIAFDPVDNYVVLFGGCSALACPVPAQSWKYSDGSWSPLVLTSGAEPPARAFASMVFDSRDGYLLLFGGWAGPGRYLNDTWGFSDGTWTNLTNVTTAPPARSGAMMAYDHLDGYVVLFGGCGSTQCPRNDTWRFQLGAWKNLSVPAALAPPARVYGSMVWDDNDGYAVLFGGQNATGALLNDTWQFVHGKWTLSVLTGGTGPSARDAATMTYFGLNNAAYLIGGNGTTGTLSDVWRFAADAWTNETGLVSPVPGARQAAAGFESSLYWSTSGVKGRVGFFLLFGGTGAGCLTCERSADSDTWIFEVALGATANALPAIVEVGQPSAFSATVTGGAAPFGYAWQFGDGTTSPSATPAHSYLTVAIYSANVTVTDAAGVTTRTTVSVMVLSGPIVTTRIQPRFTDIGRPVAFNATTTGGTPPYTTRWSFGDTLGFTGGSTTHSYGAPGSYLGNVSVSDSVLGVGLGVFAITVNASVTLSTTLPDAAVDRGTNASFSASPSLGTPPYSVVWTFGDGATSTSPSAVHAYGADGSYNASVEVTDSVGASRWDNFSVQVVSPAGSHAPASFLSTTWPWLTLVAVLIIAVVVGLLYFRRRRRRSPNVPIAAAAVGEMSWNQEDSENHSSDSRSSRRARYRR